jgi:hypothetical protein
VQWRRQHAGIDGDGEQEDAEEGAHGFD